jgi:hypothetical protein
MVDLSTWASLVCGRDQQLQEDATRNSYDRHSKSDGPAGAAISLLLSTGITAQWWFPVDQLDPVCRRGSPKRQHRLQPPRSR